MIPTPRPVAGPLAVLAFLFPLAAQGATRFVAKVDVLLCAASGAGSGLAVGYLHEPANVLVYELRATGLTGIADAVIRRLPPGLPPVLVATLSGGSGTWCGKLELTRTQRTWLDSGELHVDVRTAACPGGAIRGQLAKHDPASFACDLQPALPLAARGHAALEILPEDSFRYAIRAQALTGPGTVWLERPGAPPFSLGTAADAWAGTIAISPAARADLRAGSARVRIATPLHPLPAGELAGPITIGRRPIPFGTGGAGGTGIRPEIGSDTLPCIGDRFRCQLYAGAPSSGAWLLVGGAVRPWTLAPGNVVQIDPLAWHALFAFPTDANGCAGCTLPMPDSRSLLGRHLYAQWIVLDPAAPSGLTVSNAIDATIQ
jgi:hypothetical protein